MFSYIKLGLIVAAVAALGFMTWRVYEAGYNSASGVYEARLQVLADAAAAETVRQARAAQEATMVANAAISVLEIRNENLTKGLADETVLANKAPGANNACLPLAGVQRLNAATGSNNTHSKSRPDYSKVSKTHHITKPSTDSSAG